VNAKICGNAYGEFAAVSTVIPRADFGCTAIEITFSLDWCRLGCQLESFNSRDIASGDSM
jgi:hypothetical protein